MRVGIYLGRHTSVASGMAVYAAAVVRRTIDLLSEPTHENDEVVIYGDSTLLTEVMLNEISLHPLLSQQSQRLLDFGAAYYFRSLPNGARCRLLIRVLPRFLERRLAGVLDQVAVPYLCWRDKIDVLHSLANCGIIGSGIPQIITVHDLFQAWPVKENATNEARSIKQLLLQSWYKFLFKQQFQIAKQILTDIKEVASEIRKRFPLSKAAINVVPLGVDEQFVNFGNQLSNGSKTELLSKWLRSHGISQTGFVLCLASCDPRKNLARILEAWTELPAEAQKCGLVVKVDGAASERAARKQLSAFKLSNICYLKTLAREEMPLLFGSAAVLLHPTLAEGFGLPALEALTVGSAVVSSKLEALQNHSSDKIFYCNPLETESIRAALETAIEQSQNKTSPSATAKTEPQKPHSGAINRATYRTMLDVVRENFAAYKDVQLRYKLRG